MPKKKRRLLLGTRYAKRKRLLRSTESAEEAAKRLEDNCQRMRQRRSSQLPQATAERREDSRQRMKRKRSLETLVSTAKGREDSQQRMTRKRSLDQPEATAEHHEHIRQRRTKAKSLELPGATGEKPYDCSNCNKRFSHISSKKCVGAEPPNGITQTSIKPPPPTTRTTPVVISLARMILKEDTESKPLQEQLPVTQIKSPSPTTQTTPAVSSSACMILKEDTESKPLQEQLPVTQIKSPSPTTQTTPAVSSSACMILKEDTESKPLQEQLPVTQIKSTSPTTQTTPVVIAPARMILKEDTESKPLQEQLPITQIKSPSPTTQTTPAVSSSACMILKEDTESTPLQEQLPVTQIKSTSPTTQTTPAVSSSACMILKEDNESTPLQEQLPVTQIKSPSPSTQTTPVVISLARVFLKETERKPLQEQLPVTQIKSTSPTTQTAPVVIAPARMILKEKTESKPLQEQLPVTQIKSEPVEYECKPVMAAPATSSGTNGVVNGGAVHPALVPATTVPQGVALSLPIVRAPMSINLNVLQNVLKLAMSENVLRQVLGTANGVVTQGKQGIVQRQLVNPPVLVVHNGTKKIIIKYKIRPAAATTATTQPIPLFIRTNFVPPPTVTTAAAPTPTKIDKPSTPEVTDLSIVKAEPESVAVTQTQMTSDTPTAQMPKVNSTSTCLLCDECPDNLEALHLLQHYKAANGEAIDSAALDPSFAGLLSGAGVMLEEPPVDDVLSLLKTYFASNANPSEVGLTKISESVSIPVDVVRKWFAKMNSGKNVGKYRNEATAVCKKTENTNSSSEDISSQNGDSSESGSASPSDSSPISLNTEDLVIVKCEPEDPDFPNSKADLLDLSLPKHNAASLETTTPPAKQQEQPLTCLRKEQLEGRTIYVTTPQTGKTVNIVAAAQLCTLAAIAGQGTVGCLSAINTTTKRPILSPQFTYVYVTTAGNVSGANVLNSNKHEKRLDRSSDGVSELIDPETAALMKKQQLKDRTVYRCDVCPKVFRNYSVLLRHKYEHTGKRPHQCNTCNKAFKHKHHLVEHTRTHSGEKPFQCNRCDKRFSHSGSYSQHMNKHSDYCWLNSGSGLGPQRVQSELGSPGAVLQSDGRTTSPPSQQDSDKKETVGEEAEGEKVDEESFSDVMEIVVGDEHMVADE
ncbi:uncharacterized protein LOC141777745 [Sebastes fasciatus]|uniref:uncharacterized protein LOC141777745 n=1 Tax=Sebastes fasciatus TaxID=394691 RepID=UPI003D9DF8D2